MAAAVKSVSCLWRAQRPLPPEPGVAPICDSLEYAQEL